MDFVKYLRKDEQPVSDHQTSTNAQQPHRPRSSAGGLLHKLEGAIGSQGQHSADTGQQPSGASAQTHHSGGFIGKLEGAFGNHVQQTQAAVPAQGGHGSTLMGKVNNALGGGEAGERKEDGLDKTVDWVQEHILHQGPQNNESAIEQAKDEQISDAIRKQYKKMTGKEFFIKDK